nr:ribosomal protein L18 [Proteomonas sp. NIES-1005]BDA98604.1 ribosomal protein L18 [Proteomonas sp. NEIS-1375]
MKNSKKSRIAKIKKRIRSKIKGTAEIPRLAVFRSNEHIYAQVIDDVAGNTLVSSSTLDREIRQALSSGATCEASKLVGEAIAKKSLENQITNVVFDRGGHIYHGRVKALAEAARDKGLQF